MSWTECDGPPIAAPKRRGFGTTVIEAMAKHSLDGVVDLISTLTCDLAFRLPSSERTGCAHRVIWSPVKVGRMHDSVRGYVRNNERHSTSF
jgi:hypothetical protein